MSIRMNERDLAALRAGIAEQVARDERESLMRERFNKLLAKRLLDRVKLIDVCDLVVGDVIAEGSVTTFRAEMVVKRIATTTEDGQNPAGDVWVTTNLCGQAMRYGEQILVEDRG